MKHAERTREHFRSRLTHLGLHETVGGKEPPDLSLRILAAVDHEEATATLVPANGDDSVDAAELLVPENSSFTDTLTRDGYQTTTVGTFESRPDATQPSGLGMSAIGAHLLRFWRGRSPLAHGSAIAGGIAATVVLCLYLSTWLGHVDPVEDVDQMAQVDAVDAQLKSAEMWQNAEICYEAEVNIPPGAQPRPTIPPRVQPEADGMRWMVAPNPMLPRVSGDQYERIEDHGFERKRKSTFSIDVDTAAYSNVRDYLTEGLLPPVDAIRVEELINYFNYGYAPPSGDVPFAIHTETAGCPWNEGNRLVRIGLKGQVIPDDDRPPANLVFLIDVSGSMQSANKLPLAVRAMQMLATQLDDHDRVAIVVYASSEGLALPSTPGNHRQDILAALGRLSAGGSTNGGAGIKLAYRIAQDNFVEGGINRVILCTDGDFNVGLTQTESLESLAIREAKSGVYLSVMGFGRGNLNDAMMERISNKANGNYGYIDNIAEARKVFGQQLNGTLMTIAKDVKIQVEFNKEYVKEYRLVGYENRRMANRDFNDDSKDAGEIGAGHTVTALYEVVPVRGAATPTRVLTLRLRYKQPDEDESRLLEQKVRDPGTKFEDATSDFQFAAAVAAFGQKLRRSPHQGAITWGDIQEIAARNAGADHGGLRAEFLKLVRLVPE